MSEPKRIIVVDDENQITRVLKRILQAHRYDVRVAADGESALEMFADFKPDLVITDLSMPVMDGIELCRGIRRISEVPIIVLSVRGEESTKVSALDVGADDYITKPFGVRELLARLKAILRRSQAVNVPGNESTVTIGRLIVNFNTFQTKQDGVDIKLSHKEVEILAYLFKNSNKVVSRYDLLEHVWGYEEQITTRTVDNFIARLRQKVEDNPNNPRIILTVHGSGYKMVR